jgi:hypothetical protein
MRMSVIELKLDVEVAASCGCLMRPPGATQTKRQILQDNNPAGYVVWSRMLAH